VHLEPKPTPEDPNCPPGWRAKPTITPQSVLQSFSGWLNDQRVLIEAFWVAVTFHVLIFPLVWFVGWALPWPKPPMITTVIEINLENWPNEARPTKIEEIYNYEKSRSRQSH
jgi:hypothetical protein